MSTSLNQLISTFRPGTASKHRRDFPCFRCKSSESYNALWLTFKKESRLRGKANRSSRVIAMSQLSTSEETSGGGGGAKRTALFFFLFNKSQEAKGVKVNEKNKVNIIDSNILFFKDSSPRFHISLIAFFKGKTKKWLKYFKLVQVL